MTGGGQCGLKVSLFIVEVTRDIDFFLSFSLPLAVCGNQALLSFVFDA